MFVRKLLFISQRSIAPISRRFLQQNVRRRRLWPVTIGVASATAAIPIGHHWYRLWTDEQKSSTDDQDESVSQAELDLFLDQTQRLLDAEIYQTRSSSFLVPLRLFFRTIKLICVFTPVAIFYFVQNQFFPQFYETWCRTLKR